jgi:hypothetical protein
VAIGFGYLAYAYLTLPDVRPLKTSNPTSTAFMELARGRAGARHRRIQRWIGAGRSLPDRNDAF